MKSNQFLIPATLIVIMTFWIYSPAFRGDWLWDDALLVADNALIHDPAGLWKIWFEPSNLFDYQPIEVSVVWLEWHLWGANTLGYHLVSVLLHLLSALLIWRLLGKFGLRLAWLGGLLFAAHPVMVESVAWIAELKNTLSLPPFLLAMCAYMDYEEHGKRNNYRLALGLFFVAMLCKASMVMFPFVILLYAWWRRGRVSLRDLASSLPFMAVSIAVGLLNLWFLQRTTHDLGVGASDIHLGGFFSRLALAGASISFYVGKCLFPAGLLSVYPQWDIDPFSPAPYVTWIILGGVTLVSWMKRKNWGRHVLLGLGFFLINLALFVGFNVAPYMGFTWVMDHMLYLPIVGLIGLAVAGLEQIELRCGVALRAGVDMAVAPLLALLAWESHGYAVHYRNSETLWTYTLQHNPRAWPGHDNLGHELLNQGRIPEAMEQFKQMLEVNPHSFMAHNSLGLGLVKMGRLDEAIGQFQETLRINPDFLDANYNLGTALLVAGQAEKAIPPLERALQINPRNANAHYNLGVAFERTNRIQEAMAQYRAVLEINPDYAEAHKKLGNLLLQTGHAAEAAEQDEAALRNDPHYSRYREELKKAAPAKN